MFVEAMRVTAMENVTNPGMKGKKVVVYSVGKMLEQHGHLLNWDNVVAVMDVDESKQGSYIEGKEIVKPGRLSSDTYDYVLIFSDKYFEGIKDMLIGYYFFPEDKIVSWRILSNKYTTVSNAMARLYRAYITDHTPCNVLDSGNQFLGKYFMSFWQDGVKIDAYGSEQFVLYNSLYNAYVPKNQINKTYDIVFLFRDYGEDIVWDVLMQAAGNCIIWTVPYCDRVDEKYAVNIERLECWGDKKVFLFPQSAVYVFKKKKENQEGRCEIYVAMHKEFNVLSNNIYKPVCVGSAYQNQAYYYEQMGENIADLNDRINECTALYWIWKNTASDYVGLCHYRRYLCNNEIVNGTNYLTGEKAMEIFLDGYDIILPKLTRLSITILDNIRKSVGKELCEEALDVIRGLLAVRVPAYTDAFEYVMSGNVLYKCHIFVTSRSMFDTYCNWLFSFIVDAAKMLDVSHQDAHHKRVIGYFAETMLTVWLLMQKARIKELPLLEI